MKNTIKLFGIIVMLLTGITLIACEKEPVEISISVSPSNAEVGLGKTAVFKASIKEGSKIISQDVTWSVLNNNNRGTSINSKGVLTVAANENNSTLAVQAVAKIDKRLIGTASVDIAVPVITINKQPAATTSVIVGNISGSLSVSASAQGATLSYQWYSNTTASNTGGTVINGATGSSYTIPTTLTAGTHYYFVEIRVAGGAISVRSNVATVRVLPPPLPVEMVRINPGTFTMGNPTNEADRNSSETQHQVTISKSFYMGKYEVTQEQYRVVTGVNPSNFSSNPAAGEIQGRRPVERVTWYDAVEFCNKLSEKESLTPVYTITGRTPTSGYPITSATVTVNWSASGYRLPTEAEWEYACRAGTTTAYNTGNTISYNTGWYSSNNNSGRTHEVGLKPPNAWGLYDMHGNVWEWCWDWYVSYAIGAQTDPTGAASGSYRVRRGGSWLSVGQDLRSEYRGSYGPYGRGNDLGFRLLRP